MLVLVLMIVNDAMRRETNDTSVADSMTAGEMLRAMALYRQMLAEPAPGAEDIAAAEAVVAAGKSAEPSKETDAIVTPIELGRGKRGEGPARS